MALPRVVRLKGTSKSYCLADLQRLEFWQKAFSGGILIGRDSSSITDTTMDY